MTYILEVNEVDIPEEIDWKDKTVAVLGTGSSAIQMVPQIQKSRHPLISLCVPG